MKKLYTWKLWGTHHRTTILETRFYLLGGSYCGESRISDLCKSDLATEYASFALALSLYIYTTNGAYCKVAYCHVWLPSEQLGVIPYLKHLSLGSLLLCEESTNSMVFMTAQKMLLIYVSLFSFTCKLCVCVYVHTYTCMYVCMKDCSHMGGFLKWGYPKMDGL